MVDVPEAITSVKAILDILRSTIGLVRDAKNALPNSPEKEAIESSIAEAETASKVSEAMIADALGYELCRCEFPPIIMMKVGFQQRRGTPDVKEIFECPKCKQNNAGNWSFVRQDGL